MSGKGNGKALLKKVLKFVGWFFLVIVLAVGVGVLGAWMTGSFDPEKIYIQKLTINGVKEYVTITQNDTSYTTQVDFAPADANQLTLTAKILTGGNLIEPLSNVVAGQPIQLKFKKDDRGITQGGEVEIKFIDSAQKAFATLKVLIDVSLDSNHIEITSNGADLTVNPETNVLSTNVLTTVTKESANTIKISAGYDEMLNSYKGNWSQSENNSQVNLSKLKKMILRYKKDVSVNDFEVTEVIGDENYYLIKYLTPATTHEAFVLDVYLYKTYFLESVFEEAFANSLMDALETGNFERTSINYDRLNAFINNYVYNNSSLDVKNNFGIFAENGLIVLTPVKYARNSDEFRQAIQDTLDYVLVSKRILITVDNIEVTNIRNDKSSTNLEYLVLQNYEYVIDDTGINIAGNDIPNKENLGLGIELEGQGDKNVLKNILRDLDIVLCYAADATHYEEEINNGTTVDDKIQVTKEFFKVGTTYLKKVDSATSDRKFSITKNIADDGSVSWTFKAISPTHTSDKYYLLYSYTKNDFETAVSFIPDDETNLNKYEYDAKKDAWYQVVGTKTTLVVNLDIINKCYNRKYACTPLVVEYTNGVIQYNTTTDGKGDYVINNVGKTSIVLNEMGTIYKNDFDAYDNPIPRVVEHGSNGGVYYRGRDFSVGIRSNENEVMTENVIIKPINMSEKMEYTHVKWFVKYTDNIIHDGDPAPATNNKYYFKPTVNVKYDDSPSKVNEIPILYKLKHISENTFLESEEYFMEIGDGDFTLEALNSMFGNSEILLYAVIIQTDLDGNPFEVERTIKEGVTYVTYNFVSYTNEHSINSAQFIDKLNFYVNTDSGYKEAITTDGKELVHNFLDVEQDEENCCLYLTNVSLNSSGKAIFTNGDWTDGDKIVMQYAIDFERNYRIALTRFYNDIVLAATTPGTVWNYSEYNMGSSHPTVVPTISRGLQTDENTSIASNDYIKFTIENKNASMTGEVSYILSVTTDKNMLKDMFYTKASTIGYFKLKEKPVQSS